MKSEIENVIKEIKCGRASGNDDIATEMIKAMDDEGIKKITELCNLVYDTDNYDPANAWSDRVDSGPTLIQTACPQPRPVLPPGADLPCKQCVKLNRLRCGTACDTLKLWDAQESAMCACGHTTQSVQHVGVACMIHKAPGGFADLRRPDAATRSLLEDLNIEI